MKQPPKQPSLTDIIDQTYNQIDKLRALAQEEFDAMPDVENAKGLELISKIHAYRETLVILHNNKYQYQKMNN